MYIRPVGPAFAPVLAALHGTCFADDSRAWSEAAIGALLVSGICHGWIAVGGAGDTAPPVGLVMARSAGDEGEILTLGVVPAMRRRGVARRLLAAALAAFGADGVKRLFLEVAAADAGACAFYRALAFSEVGRRPDYYGGGRDALVLARAPVVD